MLDHEAKIIKIISVRKLYRVQPFGKNSLNSHRLGRLCCVTETAYHRFKEAGCSGQKHFCDTYVHGCFGIIFRIIALENPDTFAKPRDELQIISGPYFISEQSQEREFSLTESNTSNQTLRRVHVCRYQSGYYNTSRQIDLFFLWIFGLELGGFPNIYDEVTAHENGAIENDFSCYIDGDNSRVFEEHYCGSSVKFLSYCTRMAVAAIK